MDTIQGIIKHIIYKNESNYYTVMDIDADGELVSATGYIMSVSEGESISAEGEWYMHPDYGEQFKIQKFTIEAPQNLESIRSYLKSGLLSGIGEKKADDLLAVFGENVLDVIENNPERLKNVKGIGEKTAQSIHEDYLRQTRERSVVMALSQYGISVHTALKLFEQYEGNTVSVVKDDPYRLIDEFSGIGFVKADAIARSVGIESHAPKRIRAGIRYCLGLAAQRGHTYLPETVLTTESARILQVSKDETEYELDRLYSEGTVILDDSIDNRRSYLPYLYESEKKCAEQLYAIKTGTKKTCTTDVHSFIQQYQAFTGIELDPIQCDAVSAAVSGKITLITGGPGTGKTTIIKAIIYLLSLQGQNFALTAPTGRAAKRMSETCGYEAKTIHRLLEYGYQPHSGRTEYSEDPFLFFRGEDNPLDYDCVIIDELSMVDIPLMAQFLSAIRPETSLVFVGDADQLASVGPGNVLSDLLDSGYLHTVRLQTVFRQSNESLIITNAHRINEGLMPELDANKTDFLFVNAVSQQKIAAKIYGMIQNDDFDLLKMIHKDNVQLISPLKKGEAGVITLNQHLQQILNPRNGNLPEVDIPSYHLRKGDKVMQIRNDYSMPWRNIYTHQKGEGVYNGDMGFVREIDPIAKQLYVLFDNERMASYAFTEISSLTLAYAITVHKSQGSEFPCVLIPVFSANPDFLTRNLIYTAVTRAKEKVILVGEKRVLYAMIQNNRTQKRYSGLRERLAGYEC